MGASEQYARAPFADEPQALAIAAARRIPVPTVLGTTGSADAIAMILVDLGAATRLARPGDAARAGAWLHRGGPALGLPLLDEAALTSLPTRTLAALDTVPGRRTPAARHAASLLAPLERVAAQRAAGGEREPFGICHGDLHHPAIHIGAARWHVLDMAMARNGPGLLELASWYGTRRPPDPHRLGRLIDAYVAAGGSSHARADRGGLAAPVWALAWHRIWAAAWHIEQALSCLDDASLVVAHRQLAAAAELMGV
ncbi:phosphotransferase [Micromonospora sp. CPCC 205371]|nr:phosphotransferase [Micromonospora sp. CPCC 205371]